jgi:hypothetical protein
MMMMICYNRCNHDERHFERSPQRFQIKTMLQRSEKSDAKKFNTPNNLEQISRCAASRDGHKLLMASLEMTMHCLPIH